MRQPLTANRLLAACAMLYLAIACITQASNNVMKHRWWAGLGPVLPHDSFPADCTLCHIEGNWQTMREDFHFDHAKETGVALQGAHEEARCLRCHNDRGPVAIFQARGCGGCHEDVHFGDLGADCSRCHQENTWQPHGQVELHSRTRFPLTGVHALTSCRRCHVGAPVGNFLPLDTACVSCHREDLARTTNHVGLGWVDRCDRCHIPTRWEQARVGQ